MADWTESCAALASSLRPADSVQLLEISTLLNEFVGGVGLFEDSLRSPAKSDENESLAIDAPPEQSDDNEGEEDIEEDTIGEEEIEEDTIGEEEVAEDSSIDEAVRWLKERYDWIKKFHNAVDQSAISLPSLAQGINAKPHQVVAFEKIRRSQESEQKGIMLADSPGLGKTLPVMMAIAEKKKQNGRSFSLCVVPASCCDQWEAEFKRFLPNDSLEVMVLRHSNFAASCMYAYDVVIVSYQFAMHQHLKWITYMEKIIEHLENPSKPLPKRPNLSLFSELHGFKEPRISYLVLDEVTAVKNSDGSTFQAILHLRSRSKFCVMMTGSPLDNTWLDTFSCLRLLLGHSIDTKRIMKKVFGTFSANERLKPPRGNNFCRFVQMLNSFVVRRPEQVLQLPPLYQETLTFNLPEAEAAASNKYFREFRKALNMRKDGETGKDDIQPWRSLMKAIQMALHPDLMNIMGLLKLEVTGDKWNFGLEERPLHKKKDLIALQEWKDQLKVGRRWESAQILAIIQVFNRYRDLDCTSNFLIFDESVYFLDVVEIAFANMSQPVQCVRYDGRENPGKRSKVLKAFNTEISDKCKVMLVSRASGGVGLNIPAANVVILCGPWWKTELENQAIKRAHRPGQNRPVSAVRVKASNAFIEKYKARTRDKKDSHNIRVVK